MSGWLIAIISGALMSIQGVFNTEVTKTSGIWVSGGWVQMNAFFNFLAAWLFTGREHIRPLLEVEPKYMLLGGVMGAFITFTVIKSMEDLGPAKAVMIIVVAQLLAAYLIEVFGVFGVEKTAFEWKKMVGMALAIGGIILFKW